MANDAIASSMDFFSTRSAVALSSEDISLLNSLSKSSRLFFAFVFFFFNDEFFLREKCKKRRICVSGFTKKSCVSFFLFSLLFAFFCFLLFFCSPAALFLLCFLRFLSAPPHKKKSRTFFSRTHATSLFIFRRHIF